MGKLERGIQDPRCVLLTEGCACRGGHHLSQALGLQRGSGAHGWPPPNGPPIYSATKIHAEIVWSDVIVPSLVFFKARRKKTEKNPRY